jgi:predicted nucleic acid-binding protein
MSGILVDASVAASWLFDDETSEIAQKVLSRLKGGVPAFAPSLWLLEMTNLLFNAERRKRIDRRHRDASLERMARLPITILSAPTLSDLGTLSLYAEKYQLTAYDAEYLRVAKEQKLVLATLDGNLVAAAKREKVPVVGL